jgi:hypothetical protein
VKDTFGGQYFPPGTPAEMMPVNANFLQPVIRLFQQIYYRGYEVANFEYNPESIEECCQEYTFIRV